MSDLKLKEAQRQSPVGAAVIFFKNLRIAINVLISLVAVQYGFKIDTSSGFFIGAVGLIFIVFVVIAILQYRNFHFYVKDDQFIIEKGLLSRDKTSVSFDRIQSVHITQNLIQQILGVVGLKIDTAGSAEKEFEIPALNKSYARNLQEYLLKQKKSTSEEEEFPDEDIAEKKALLRFSLGDVFKVGLTENHLRTGFILFAVINGYVWQYEEYLLKPFKPYLENYESIIINEWLILLPIAIVAFIIISVLLSLIQSFLRYYNLIFFVENNGAQLSSGLLKRTEYQIPLNKIQFIKWSSNPLRKIIGLKTLIIKQAGSNEGTDKQSLKIPGSRMAQIHVVLNNFFPNHAEEPTVLYKAHPLFKRRLIIMYGLIPSLLLSLLLFINIYFIIIPIIWLISGVFFSLKFAPTLKLKCNEEMLFLKKGWLFPQTIALQYYKLQAVGLHQTIFMRKEKLANLDFFTAAGNMRMWYIPANEAHQIYNYLLYKIESSKEGWM